MNQTELMNVGNHIMSGIFPRLTPIDLSKNRILLKPSPATVVYVVLMRAMTWPASLILVNFSRSCSPSLLSHTGTGEITQKLFNNTWVLSCFINSYMAWTPINLADGPTKNQRLYKIVTYASSGDKYIEHGTNPNNSG